MSGSLVVNEIYLSLQGESTFAGLPCVFVRLTACNLRCSYCDTAYAFTEGRRMAADDVVRRVIELAGSYATASLHSEVERTGPPDVETKSGTPSDPSGSTPLVDIENPRPRLPLVEFTGGEPLLQPAVLPVMTQLCDAGFTVLVETSGALDIVSVDPRVRRIMDLKCPSSGECGRNRIANLRLLRATDELKFVIGTLEDYEWAKEMIFRHQLAEVCPLLFSWVSPIGGGQRDPSLRPVPPGQTPLTRRQLAERIIADALPVRFQLQMHKFIWPADERGV